MKKLRTSWTYSETKYEQNFSVSQLHKIYLIFNILDNYK